MFVELLSKLYLSISYPYMKFKILMRNVLRNINSHFVLLKHDKLHECLQEKNKLRLRSVILE